MIVQLIKTTNNNDKENPKAIRYALFAKNAEVGNIILTPQQNNYDGYLKLPKATYYFKNIYPVKSFHFCKNNQASGRLINKDQASTILEPSIYDDKGTELAKATLSTYGKHFSNGTPCLYLNFKGNTYSNYLIGIGEKGLYFSLYNNNDLIAVASKPKNKKNPDYSYTLYIKNDNQTVITIITTIMLHVMKYENTSFHNISYITPEQIVKEKYNSNFIDEVINKEGKDNLPENMPIIKAFLKKKKKKKQFNYLIIVLILLIIIALIIIL